MPTISAERLADVFVEVADTMVDEFDLIEFLQMIADRTAQIVDVSAAGLLLADHHGRLQFMAASSEATKLLELFQLQHKEGPCLDAFRHAAPVVNADLAAAGDSWPVFAPRAVAAGFRSVHAFPMRLRRNVVGALNLFGADVGRLVPEDIHIVQALTDVATIGLLQQRAIRRGEVLAEQLQVALNSRVVIEQAKGAIAQLGGVSVDEAFDLLRGYARRHHRRISELAHEVVSNPARYPELLQR